MALNFTPKPSPNAVVPGGEKPRQSMTIQTQRSPSTLRAAQMAAIEAKRHASPPVDPHALPTKEQLSRVAPPPTGGTGVAAIEPPPTSQKTIVEGQEPPAEATNQALGPQYAALARKEQAVRKAQLELKAEKEAWQTRVAAYIPKERLQAEPLAALTEAGISYDKLVELQLAQGQPDPNQALLNEIAELKKRLDGQDSQMSERDKRAYDQAVSQIRNDAKLLVDSDPTYETIKATGSTDQVVDLITAVFNAEGVVLSVEDAALQIENKLVDQMADQVKRLSELGKIKSRLAPPEPTAAEATSPLKPQTRTLTNATGVTRPLSARERAILAFKGELK